MDAMTRQSRMDYSALDKELDVLNEKVGDQKELADKNIKIIEEKIY